MTGRIRTMTRWLPLLAVTLLVLMATPRPLAAWGSFCDECWTKFVEGTPQYDGYTEAQCCVAGTMNCELLQNQGYDMEKWAMEWCSETWVVGTGYVCNGESGSCQSGGGGGGGDDGGGGGGCTIRPGQWCPPSCAACDTVM